MFLIACQGPVEYVIKEVPTPVYVELNPKLTADVLPPARPPYGCTDAQGRITLCNRELVDWLNGYDGQLGVCRAQLGHIRDLQPKPEGGPQP